ncbi:pantothenate kinase [Rathayibacter sp. PhB152]|uniref:nucleoside/nucleotide kinase family protein n=1 Tax=unclassified Rathayibacter TaxID=2609250 RepID=UPI000F4B40E7|nr:MULTISPECIES: nucleoside/nucleotide kinase family protein [unclassified Rathayibacter]ROQ65138.1 pantothenate kinase [Rathayibacter sp. PhB152]ROS28300.1 pantothenate kinase [Rathayibacter sp. PhB127]
MATPDLDELARRALALRRSGRRAVLALAGSPGAGKTTLARAVVARANELAGEGTAAFVPMDGFHLANAMLDELGRHGRKGAIDTFDGWGFLALVRRLGAETDHVVYAPTFERTVDEGVAGSLAVRPEATLVVVEGNYLLVDDGPWALLRAEFDEAWFCATPESERFERLVDRHVSFGRAPEAASAWAADVDGANAVLIEATRDRADLVVSGTAAGVLPAVASA